MRQKWTGFQLCAAVTLVAASVGFLSGCHQQLRSSTSSNTNDLIFFPLSVDLVSPPSCGTTPLYVIVARYVPKSDPQTCAVLFYNHSTTGMTEYIYVPTPNTDNQTVVSCTTYDSPGHTIGSLSWKDYYAADFAVPPGFVKGTLQVLSGNGTAACKPGQTYQCLFWNNSSTPTASCSGTVLEWPG